MASFVFIGMKTKGVRESEFYGNCLTKGLGLGFVYSATNITIGFYFDRLRGLAAGVANSFQAVGILSGSVIFQALMEEFNVSGAFLLLGGFSLHFCFFAMFFRPTEYEGGTREIVIQVQEDPPAISAENPSVADHSKQLQTLSAQPNSDVDSRKPLLEKRVPDDVISDHVIPTCHPDTDDVNKRDTVLNINSSSDIGEFSRELEAAVPEQHSENSNVHEICETEDSSAALLEADNEQISDNAAEAGHKDSQPHGSCRAESCLLSAVQKQGTIAGSAASISLLPDKESSKCVAEESSIPHGYRQSEDGEELSIKKWWCLGSYAAVLENKGFLMYSASLFVSNVHVSGVFLHLPKYALLNGTSPFQAAELFLALGALSLLSKLSCGFATSDRQIDPLLLTVGLMGLNGIITCFFPLYADTFPKQVVFASLFGLYFGGLYALVTPILVRFVGVSRLADSYGISMFLLGVGYTVGPTLAAMIVDGGWTYDHSFLFLGIMMLCGAFLNMGAAYFLETDSKTTDGLAEV